MGPQGAKSIKFYVDPEICICGARMIVDDVVTDGEKIAETLARLARRFASVHRPS